MDAETQRKVEETVLDILRSSDMAQTTEYKIRNAASDRLGIDLSVPDRKSFVREVVQTFLDSKCQEINQSAGKEGEEEEKQKEHDQQETEVREEPGGSKKREYDDNGDLIICHLSNKRRVTLQEFKGKTLVSIREFYERDGKLLPSARGMSLTVDQWKVFKNAVPGIESAIEKLK